MAHWLEHLLGKHRNLRQDPQNTHKMLDIWIHIWNPRGLVERERCRQGNLWKHAGQLVWCTRQRTAKRPCLKQGKGGKTTTWDCPLISICMGHIRIRWHLWVSSDTDRIHKHHVHTQTHTQIPWLTSLRQWQKERAITGLYWKFCKGTIEQREKSYMTWDINKR